MRGLHRPDCRIELQNEYTGKSTKLDRSGPSDVVIISTYFYTMSRVHQRKEEENNYITTVIPSQFSSVASVSFFAFKEEHNINSPAIKNSVQTACPESALQKLWHISDNIHFKSSQKRQNRVLLLHTQNSTRTISWGRCPVGRRVVCLWLVRCAAATLDITWSK